MPNIELLAYFPKNREDFLFFLINGAPDAHGGWLPDIYGRRKTGVFNWLYGRDVPEAHFYMSDPKDPIQIFAATVERLEQTDVPWTDNLCGFMDLIITNGNVGDVFAFLPTDRPITTVKPRSDLDGAFVNGRGKLNRITESVATDASKAWSFDSQLLRAALRGEPGTDLRAVFEETNEKLDIASLV